MIATKRHKYRFPSRLAAETAYDKKADELSMIGIALNDMIAGHFRVISTGHKCASGAHYDARLIGHERMSGGVCAITFHRDGQRPSSHVYTYDQLRAIRESMSYAADTEARAYRDLIDLCIEAMING